MIVIRVIKNNNNNRTLDPFLYIAFTKTKQLMALKPSHFFYTTKT